MKKILITILVLSSAMLAFAGKLSFELSGGIDIDKVLLQNSKSSSFIAGAGIKTDIKDRFTLYFDGNISAPIMGMNLAKAPMHLNIGGNIGLLYLLSEELPVEFRLGGGLGFKKYMGKKRTEPISEYKKESSTWGINLRLDSTFDIGNHLYLGASVNKFFNGKDGYEDKNFVRKLFLDLSTETLIGVRF